MIMQDLGVDISSFKSHTSENVYEFAKRWFMDGKEFTGIPLNSFLQNYNRPLESFVELKNQESRGISSIELKPCLDMVISLATIFGRKPSQVRYLRNIVRDFGVNLSVLNGTYNYESVRRFLANATFERDGYPLPNESAMLLEYNRVGSQVVSTMILDIIVNIQSYGHDLGKNFPKLYPGIDHDSLDLELLRQGPLWSSLHNSLVQVKAKYNQLLKQRSEMNLLDLLETVSLTDINLMASRERKSKLIMRSIQSFSSKLYKELRLEPLRIVPPGMKYQPMDALTRAHREMFLDPRESSRFKW